MTPRAVVVTDTLPAGLTIVTPLTAPALGAAANVGNAWTWTIPTLVKNTSTTATISATVDADAVDGRAHRHGDRDRRADRPGARQQHGLDRPDDHRDVDRPDRCNGRDDYKPKQGDTIQIGIQVSNIGTADATNVVIKDVLPTGLKYVSCEPTPCEQSGLRRQSSQLFSMPLIPAGSAGTVILNVTVQASSGHAAERRVGRVGGPSRPGPGQQLRLAQHHDRRIEREPRWQHRRYRRHGWHVRRHGGTTAFTGFTAGQLMPWFMLLASLGLVALEWARRMRLVSPIGSTYGFDPFRSRPRTGSRRGAP